MMFTGWLFTSQHRTRTHAPHIVRMHYFPTKGPKLTAVCVSLQSWDEVLGGRDHARASYVLAVSSSRDVDRAAPVPQPPPVVANLGPDRQFRAMLPVSFRRGNAKRALSLLLVLHLIAGT